MAQETITQQEIDRVRGILADDPTAGRSAVANLLGCSVDRARRIIDKAKAGYTLNFTIGQKAEPQPKVQEADEVRLGGKERVISLDATTIRSVEEALEHCNVDTRKWEVERYLINKWDMGSVPRATGNDKDGWERKSTKPVVTELWQVKIWLRRIAAAPTEDEFDTAYEAYRDWIGWKNLKVKPRTARPSGTLERKVVINDLHVPFHDEDRLKEVIHREAGRATELILAGDTLDFFNFSRFPKFAQFFTPVQEFQHGQRVLNMLSEAFQRVSILPGNHDGKRMVKMLAEKGVPAAMLDYFEALCPGFSNPISLMVKDLPNVQMVEPLELDYAKFGFLYQIGDVILSHAEVYSTVPVKAAGSTLHWIESFALPEGVVQPYRAVAQAHTHGAGKVWANFGKWAYELGCLCLYPDYVSDPKIKTPRPWRKGYTVFVQEDGVTDFNESNFISLDR